MTTNSLSSLSLKAEALCRLRLISALMKRGLKKLMLTSRTRSLWNILSGSLNYHVRSHTMLRPACWKGEVSVLLSQQPQLEPTPPEKTDPEWPTPRYSLIKILDLKEKNLLAIGTKRESDLSGGENLIIVRLFNNNILSEKWSNVSNVIKKKVLYRRHANLSTCKDWEIIVPLSLSWVIYWRMMSFRQPKMTRGTST